MARNKNTKNKDIKEAANESLENARERMEMAKERLNEMKDKTEETITEKPFTSVAVAATVGALVALSLSSYVRGRKSFMHNVRDLF